MRARLLLIALVAACPAKPPVVAKEPVAIKPPAPPPEDPQPKTNPLPPELKLPTTVQPVRNTVELTIDPTTEAFTGSISIELDVKEPTKVLWLNAEDIEIESATFSKGDVAIKASPVEGGKNYIGIIPTSELPKGAITLAIKYRGKMTRADGDGIYTAQEANEWYAFTQFESTDARKAFPCFDEPGYKVPWRISIHTKKELVALANTPVASETDEPNGMKLVKFTETKPLPSYLVAFAIGPFDLLDAGKTRNGAPVRIVVPRGRGADAAYAVTATRPILDLLEDYFGMPYPYEKLDIVAVSVFNAGAMENAGLITFRQELVLTKPAEQTLGKQQAYAVTAAHEMAHMWFGDFVTLAWWDDTWLNESFATWMELKVIDKWKPEWDIPVDMVATKSGVMHGDSLDTARVIRQPIETANDIANAFDGITYSKGESVLTMMERHIGPDVFQKGVRAYLAKHAWKTATYADFVGAMTEASGKDQKPMFDAFVLQSGVPLVSFELSCKTGAAPTLALSQRRYVPTGSQIDPKRTWQVPVCVRWGAGATTGRDCTTLGAETGELALTAKTCPDWVLPNEAGLGYYRMLPKGDLLDHLLAKATKSLTLPERVGLLGDVNALVASGDVKNGVALSLVETLSKEKSHHIVDASIGIVAGIEEMVPDNLRPNYERLIKKLYRARANELGWKSKKGEDQNTKDLRPTLLSLVGGDGKDAELIKQATALTWKWLDDHKAIEPELVEAALHIAARYGDQKLFDRMHADAKKVTDRTERGRLLGAMGAFSDPKIIAQALAIMITDEFEIRESGGLLQGGFQNPRTRTLAYNFVKEHYDAISNKLPEPYRAYMAFTFVALCDDAKKKEIEEFFKPKIEKLDGGPRVYAQALEQLSLCSAARKAQTPGVVAFLKRQ